VTSQHPHRKSKQVDTRRAALPGNPSPAALLALGQKQKNTVQEKATQHSLTTPARRTSLALSGLLDPAFFASLPRPSAVFDASLCVRGSVHSSLAQQPEPSHPRHPLPHTLAVRCPSLLSPPNYTLLKAHRHRPPCPSPLATAYAPTTCGAVHPRIQATQSKLRHGH
jgi:hypothetical protein